MSETTHRGARLALASLILVALMSQLLIGLSLHDLTVARFFSDFTVLSNIATVLVLTTLAVSPWRDESPWFASARGATTVYMAVTGIVYATLLAPNLADVASPEPWIDLTLHVIGPLAMILDWAVFPPPARLGRWALASWLIFPAIYLVYSLVRGPSAAWYPYPFLDPDEVGGYGEVTLWALAFLVAIVGFGALFRWWANRRDSEPVEE